MAMKDEKLIVESVDFLVDLMPENKNRILTAKRRG